MNTKHIASNLSFYLIFHFIIFSNLPFIFYSYINTNLNAIKEFIFKSPYRKLKFESYCAKKRFMDILTNQFSKAIIALGHWTPNNNSPISRINVPSIKFLELLETKNKTISIINEFNSSQLCHLCSNRLYKYDHETNECIDSFIYSAFRYGIFCDIVFDRDSNAAVNMGNLEVYNQLQMPRPTLFTAAGNRKS